MRDSLSVCVSTAIEGLLSVKHSINGSANLSITGGVTAGALVSIVSHVYVGAFLSANLALWAGGTLSVTECSSHVLTQFPCYR